mmetsp:Transcript_48321/g.161121  ORF Transcript_48321/g.161121 Transcript_48321/m.161121 type:complete len:333 (-) Transcript_48321:725-1723(-)
MRVVTTSTGLAAALAAVAALASVAALAAVAAPASVASVPALAASLGLLLDTPPIHNRLPLVAVVAAAEAVAEEACRRQAAAEWRNRPKLGESRRVSANLGESRLIAAERGNRPEEERLALAAQPAQKGGRVEASEVQRLVRRPRKGGCLVRSASPHRAALVPALRRVRVWADCSLVGRADLLHEEGHRVRPARLLPAWPRRQAVPPRILDDVAAHEALLRSEDVAVADEGHRVRALQHGLEMRAGGQPEELASHRARIALRHDAARGAAEGWLGGARAALLLVLRVTREHVRRRGGAGQQVAHGEQRRGEGHQPLRLAQPLRDGSPLVQPVD